VEVGGEGGKEVKERFTLQSPHWELHYPSLPPFFSLSVCVSLRLRVSLSLYPTLSACLSVYEPSARTLSLPAVAVALTL